LHSPNADYLCEDVASLLLNLSDGPSRSRKRFSFLDAFSLRGAVGGIDAAGRGLRGQLLDLSLGTASIVDKNDSSSVHHHHRLSLEHRLSIANTASGEKHRQGHRSGNAIHDFLPVFSGQSSQ
jgi:hypothetical protein